MSLFTVQRAGRTVGSPIRRLLVAGVCLAVLGLAGAGTASASSDLAPKFSGASTNMTVGQPAKIFLWLTNSGPDATAGDLTLTDELPPSLSATSAAGDGWSCTLGQTVTCTTSAAVPAGGRSLGITLLVTPNAPGSGTSVLTAAYAADNNNANNIVRTPVGTAFEDLEPLLTGTTPSRPVRGGTVSLRVALRNNGTVVSGPVSLAIDLGPGLTVTDSSSKRGWQCVHDDAGRTLTCTPDATSRWHSGDSIATITAAVGMDAPSTLTPKLTVSASGDSNPANDTRGFSISLKSSSVTVPRNGGVRTKQLPIGGDLMLALPAGWRVGTASGPIRTTRSGRTLVVRGMSAGTARVVLRRPRKRGRAVSFRLTVLVG